MKRFQAVGRHGSGNVNVCNNFVRFLMVVSAPVATMAIIIINYKVAMPVAGRRLIHFYLPRRGEIRLKATAGYVTVYAIPKMNLRVLSKQHQVC